jgi:hypothetical protein
MNAYEGIEPYRDWTLVREDYDDSDGFTTDWWEAHHPIFGRVLLQVTAYKMRWSQERFNWLVDNDFPHHQVLCSWGPVGVPWDAKAIDKRIADASSS